ncbi:hypothetical protein [Bradyrhizobium cosmicum]|uniref:hypothetical protein n=1 Tax=Bradyrhizobium cosmicum TaxID=1404864 RepID=UPI0028ED43AC|nr:hypothetical protein [Bradyrhizobium cosmicum]
MRSSTSSFSVRLTAFVVVLVAVAGLSEAYCRYSKKFSDFSFYYIKLLTAVDTRNAILGDSHVGVSQLMPGYAMLGQPGQQPAELLRLVHYLYDQKAPQRVIVQAAPQWFGDYHRHRKLMLTEGAFAPSVLGFHPLVLSRTFQSTMFDNLVTDGATILDHVFPAAQAGLRRPTPEETLVWVQDWMKRSAESGRAFTWDRLEADKRQMLTISRVYDQNPIAGFEASQAARDFEEAIAFLLARGAQVCLFRTPVTAQYLQTEQLITDSRYALFDEYMDRLARSLSVPLVDFTTLSYKFDDDHFDNQDHMTGETAAEVWPLVVQRCFKQ